MKSVNFIPKEKRVWFVGDTLNQSWDSVALDYERMTQKERSKTKRIPRNPCECVLVGWLPTSDAYIYYSTQSESLKENSSDPVVHESNIESLSQKSENNDFYAAVYAGKNEKKHHDLVDPKEKPYLIYLLGCDDGSVGLRFKTEEEMKEHLALLESIDDIMDDPNMLMF